MGKLLVFEHVSLDGFFVDRNGDMSWAHKSDPEWDAFSKENASGEGILLFGRVTYDLMKSYWPTSKAMENDPELAKRMNHLPKVVFSRRLEKADWENTRLVKQNIEAEVQKMKKNSEEGLTILGSGTIVSQLTQAGLVDEYQFVVNPIVLGNGRTLFEGIKNKVNLKLTQTRSFKNGNTVLTYAL
jgi:dihydrofolate reductase